MKFCKAIKRYIVNTFYVHNSHCKITHSVILTLKTTEKLCGGGEKSQLFEPY